MWSLKKSAWKISNNSSGNSMRYWVRKRTNEWREISNRHIFGQEIHRRKVRQYLMWFQDIQSDSVLSNSPRSLSTSGKMGRIEFLEQTTGPAFSFFPSISIRKTVRGSFFGPLRVLGSSSLLHSPSPTSSDNPPAFSCQGEEEIESPYFKTRGWFL